MKLLLCWLMLAQVVNLGDAFRDFWQAARARPFAEQSRLWEERIEKPQARFYAEVVWKGVTAERRRQRLETAFAAYAGHAEEIQAGFDGFQNTLDAQSERFRQTFPDFSCDLPIYAAPVAGAFNGRSAEAGTPVLAFGIDMATLRHDDPGVLYSHELFHVYHTKAMKLDPSALLAEGRLTAPLWLEGLATYVSRQLNPDATWSSVYMDDRLPGVTPEQIRWLAGEFLTRCDQRAYVKANAQLYGNWFQLGAGVPRPDLPPRCGYVLGYHVVERLARTHSLDEMSHWGLAEVDSRVREALVQESR